VLSAEHAADPHGTSGAIPAPGASRFLWPPSWLSYTLPPVGTTITGLRIGRSHRENGPVARVSLCERSVHALPL